MINSVKARPKKSTLDNDTGKSVITTFCIQVLICLASSLAYSSWESMESTVVHAYIMKEERSFMLNVIIRMGNWILVFGNFVPISLLLTLETVKFFQGFLIGIDKGLVSFNGFDCKVQSSSLNEELGQVDFVFSDKTGTLTCNEMRFKYLIVGDEVYGKRTGYSGDVPEVKNVDFSDPKVWQISKDGFQTEKCKKLKHAITLLGLCHSVVLEQTGEYNGSSPDELAFVYFAKLVGFEFKGMDETGHVAVKQFEDKHKYKLLDIFEFNSDRKRMSVIVEDESGKISMMTKGADNIMIPRYHEDKKEKFDDLVRHLDEFAAMGLRTLMLGQKELSREEYNQFKQEYDVDWCLDNLRMLRMT